MLTSDRSPGCGSGWPGCECSLRSYDGTPGTVLVTRSRLEAMPGLEGRWGIGIGLVAQNTEVTVEDTIIEGAHSVGVQATDTALTMRRCVVRDVVLGETNTLIEGTSTVPTGDGILFIDATGDRGLTLEDVWIEGAARAGIMAKTGEHAMTRVRILGADVGLALRDGATMTQTDCDLSGNDESVDDPSELMVP